MPGSTTPLVNQRSPDHFFLLLKKKRSETAGILRDPFVSAIVLGLAYPDSFFFSPYPILEKKAVWPHQTTTTGIGHLIITRNPAI